ncbi:DDE-type integrase/transposase/recombinase [Candidatus Saccharibacteria bacterium]|nr:DDE-type integrase/transposase/recombinase [Candidatus Saccharibacteria bacterium]
MVYSISPTLQKARGDAVREVIYGGKRLCTVARRYGIHRSTLWRWIGKWREINKYVRLTNDYRPSRADGAVGKVFRWQNISWRIPTESSRPKSHPRRIKKEIVTRVLELRTALKRCADVIHHYLLQENIRIGLSSVKRILRRYHLCSRAKRAPYRRTLPRPKATAPGELVEIDTVHYIPSPTFSNAACGRSKRKYVITIIDLFSRIAYAKCFDKMSPGNALTTVMEAERAMGFGFKTVQSDNGPEFSSWFSSRLKTRGIVHRKTRIHRPNDNAHIERFNRTLREECIGRYMCTYATQANINKKLYNFLDFYNHKRLHLGIRCTPIQMLQR